MSTEGQSFRTPRYERNRLKVVDQVHHKQWQRRAIYVILLVNTWLEERIDQLIFLPFSSHQAFQWNIFQRLDHPLPHSHLITIAGKVTRFPEFRPISVHVREILEFLLHNSIHP